MEVGVLDLGLQDKIILVTAASRGLGFGTAKALIQDGARVIICGRNEDSLKQAVESLGDKAEYLVADVSQNDAVKQLLQHVKDRHGRLDGLFVNAGGPPPGTFEEITDETWESSFRLTLMSAIWLTRESLPFLKKSESPSVLYSTSISVKQPIPNLLLSNSIRPAVIGMMRTLADEVGPQGVRINAVCPGYIYTERVEQLMKNARQKGKDAETDIKSKIPLGRMGNPEEFGAVCAFLLSPKAGYVHGSLLLVDGGLYRGMM